MTRLARRPAVIGVVAAFVLVVVWLRVLWGPEGAAIASAHRRRAEATDALFSAEQRVGHLRRLAKEAPALASLQSRLDAALPATDDLPGLLDEVESDAGRSGVNVTAITAAPPAASRPAATTSLSFQLTASGGYFSLLGFLDSLREGPRLIVVDTVGFSAAPDRTSGPGGGTPLSMSLTAHAFVLPGVLR